MGVGREVCVWAGGERDLAERGSLVCTLGAVTALSRFHVMGLCYIKGVLGYWVVSGFLG